MFRINCFSFTQKHGRPAAFYYIFCLILCILYLFTMASFGATPALSNTVMTRLYRIIEHYGIRSVAEFHEKAGPDEWAYFATKLQEKMITKVNSMIHIYLYNVVKKEKYNPMSVLCLYAYEYCNELDFHDVKLVMDAHFAKNDINPYQFASDFFDILNQEHHKKNTFRIVGAPDSGKSLILRSLLHPLVANIQKLKIYTYIYKR